VARGLLGTGRVKLVAGGTLLAGAGDSKFESDVACNFWRCTQDDFVGWACPPNEKISGLA